MTLILAVDDEPDLRYILRRVFEKAGFDVHEASDGAQALEQVHAAPPDLVVTDMMMPVMGGAELIRQLHADPGTAAISDPRGERGQPTRRRADTVLGKPYRSQEIMAAATALLSQEEDRT